MRPVLKFKEKGNPWTTHDLIVLRECIRLRMTIQEIASAYGVSKTRIYKILKDNKMGTLTYKRGDI